MTKNIFTESQLGALALSLEKGDCPLKYSYITEKGSKSWSKTEYLSTQLLNYGDFDILRDNIELYLQDIGNPNEICFFDFGCGSGKTVSGMLEKVLKNGLKVHYHAFDISQNIVEMAINNIGKLEGNYSFDYSIIDFEVFNLTNFLFEIRKKYNNVPVIGLLLGNTLGNFESMERIVSNIMDSFRIQDRLVVGIERFEIYSEKRMNQIINLYQNDSEQEKSTLEYFGLKETDGEYNVIFNENNHSIEGFFKFSNDKVFNIGGVEVLFEKGDKIRLIKSTKMDEIKFSKLFLGLGLRIANMRTNNKNTFIQAFISPKKYY